MQKSLSHCPPSRIFQSDVSPVNRDLPETPESEEPQAAIPQRDCSVPWPMHQATLEALDALVTLEEACFAMPWSRKSFEAELVGNRFSRVLLIPHPGDGLETKVIGYICIWIIFEELRFLNIAVHPDFRRQGLARQLIDEALGLGREAGCCRGMLEVRESNTAAKNLYESFQFHAYATRKSYYTNPNEDAILMALESLSTPTTERRKGRGDSVSHHSSIHTVS